MMFDFKTRMSCSLRTSLKPHRLQPTDVDRRAGSVLHRCAVKLIRQKDFYKAEVIRSLLGGRLTFLDIGRKWNVLSYRMLIVTKHAQWEAARSVQATQDLGLDPACAEPAVA